MMVRKDVPFSITSAGENPSDDRDRRERQYLITMLIRMVCLGLMVFVTPYGWYTAVFALGAAFLPYVAVINANNRSAAKSGAVAAPNVAVEAADASAPSPADAPVIIRLDPHIEGPS